MTAHDWQLVTAVLGTTLVLALALLTVAIGCIDSLTDQVKRDRAERRCRYLDVVDGDGRGRGQA